MFPEVLPPFSFAVKHKIISMLYGNDYKDSKYYFALKPVSNFIPWRGLDTWILD
jgi:hypothetical protein